MVGETLERTFAVPAAAFKRQDMQDAADVRGLDIGDLEPAVAVEIADPRRVQPTVGTADGISLGEMDDLAVPDPIDRKRRADF